MSGRLGIWAYRSGTRCWLRPASGAPMTGIRWSTGRLSPGPGRSSLGPLRWICPDPGRVPFRASGAAGGRLGPQTPIAPFGAPEAFSGADAHLLRGWPDYGLRPRRARSEEHTSELQSRGPLVWRFLLD